MPKLAYFSLTGYTREFVNKLGYELLQIPTNLKEAEAFVVDDDFVLCTPTYERKLIRGPRAGQWTYIPQQVSAFFRNPDNRIKAQAVIGTGNINFYEDFTRAADEISVRLQIPVLGRIDVSGTEEEINETKIGLEKFWQRALQTSTQN